LLAGVAACADPFGHDLDKLTAGLPKDAAALRDGAVCDHREGEEPDDGARARALGPRRKTKQVRFA
jgi:hypothetical protein